MIFCWAKVVMVSLINHSLDQFWFLSSLSPIMTRVACSYVVLSLILKCSFLMFSVTRKGSCSLGTLVFLLLLQNSHILIILSLWTVLWLRLRVEWITLFYIRLDIILSNPSSSYFGILVFSINSSKGCSCENHFFVEIFFVEW